MKIRFGIIFVLAAGAQLFACGCTDAANADTVTQEMKNVYMQKDSALGGDIDSMKDAASSLNEMEEKDLKKMSALEALTKLNGLKLTAILSGVTKEKGVQSALVTIRNAELSNREVE